MQFHDRRLDRSEPYAIYLKLALRKIGIWFKGFSIYSSVIWNVKIMQYACSQKGEYLNVLTARFKDYQSTLLAQAERQIATILITLVLALD